MEKKERNAFMQRMIFDDAPEISAARFNLTIGAALLYGFLINYLLCTVCTLPLLHFLASLDHLAPAMLLIAYIVCVLAGNFLLRSPSPITCFAGYNLIVLPIGLLLSIALFAYDPYIVTRAIMATACVTMIMMMVSAMKPDLFLRIGPTLCVALIAVVIVELISSVFFHIESTLMDYVVVFIMAGFIGFDWARANVVQKTTRNALAVAASLYLDIINVFIRLLRIISRHKD